MDKKTFRRGAHAFAAAGFAVAVGMAAQPYASAAWRSPAEGGNGDYVTINAPAAGTTASGTLRISGTAGNSSTDPEGGGGGDSGFATQSQVVIAMIDTGPASGTAETLSATASTGIVASDDGGTWAGVSELGLPFP